MSTSLNASPETASRYSVKILALGFIAGFIAVPLGHQIMSLALYLAIPGRSYPWNMAPNSSAFGLPSVVNLSFWGGVWGIAWALVEPYAPKGWLKWIVAILFGGLCASAFGAYVVTAIKHLPRGSLSWIGFALNGAWGLAAAVYYNQLRQRC